MLRKVYYGYINVNVFAFKHSHSIMPSLNRLEDAIHIITRFLNSNVRQRVVISILVSNQTVVASVYPRRTSGKVTEVVLP